MNIDSGKKEYSNFADAQKEAMRMTKVHKRGFEVYKGDSGWMIGGVHLRKATPYKRVNSMSEIRLLLSEFKDSEADLSVENFMQTMELESATKVSVENGNDDQWILASAVCKSGRDLSMANDKTYLALTLRCNNAEKTIQMGGAFEPHIPLMKKLALSLINKPIVWHTWNSKKEKNKWSIDKWFYRIEENI